jgi:hypothetical protein
LIALIPAFSPGEKEQRFGALGFANACRINPVAGLKRGGRFWGCFGRYKKTFFRPLKNGCFLAVFEKRLKTPVWINEYRPSVNSEFFIFVPKGVEKGVKINIVSNLP